MGAARRDPDGGGRPGGDAVHLVRQGNLPCPGGGHAGGASAARRGSVLPGRLPRDRGRLIRETRRPMAGNENSGAQKPRPVALVTGAGGAIGRATAAGLAAAGFDLCVTDLNRSDLAPAQAAVETAGGTCRPYVCDVTDPGLVDATVAQVFAEAGRVDVLVNVAGIVHVDDLLDLTFETWRRVMSVNADGTFLMGQATARAMVRQPPSALLERRGLIVNISAAAAEVGRPTRAAYAASKAVV